MRLSRGKEEGCVHWSVESLLLLVTVIIVDSVVPECRTDAERRLRAVSNLVLGKDASCLEFKNNNNQNDQCSVPGE
jgi:hypothetical protein